jgi:hypothetical protein
LDHRQVDQGRPILARLEPECEYDLDDCETCYSDLGADYLDRLNPEGLRRRLTKRLEGLGFQVTVDRLEAISKE